MKYKYCFKCNRIIADDENYFEFIEYDKKKVVKIVYAHKVCWDEIKSTLKVTTEALGMLKGLKKKMIQEGSLPEENEILQVL